MGAWLIGGGLLFWLVTDWMLGRVELGTWGARFVGLLHLMAVMTIGAGILYSAARTFWLEEVRHRSK